jgi:NAD(P)H-flavin reductase
MINFVTNMAIKIPSATTVLFNRQISPNARVLRLDYPGNHRPGQVIGLSLPPNESLRWYSISSPPGEAWVELIYTVVEDGQLTPGLWQLQAGDKVFVQAARGSFLDPSESSSSIDQPVWWICNGTGVSPFLAMIRHHSAAPPGLLHQRRLVFGCRTLGDAYYLEEIAAACLEQGLVAVLCLSAEPSLTGVTSHLQASLLPQAGNDPELLEPGLYLHSGRLTAWSGLDAIPSGHRAMLCGASSMVSEVRDRLTGRGMILENIFAEIYF